MTIAVLGSDEQYKELSRDANINWLRIEAPEHKIAEADVYIILQETDRQLLENIKKPVLLHSVIATLQDLQTKENIVRINGWNGFLSRPVWEVSGTISDEMIQIFSALKKQYIKVKDEPGLVAARVIAMIINEAYFALEENISSGKEIDIAMKLGTNYPFGPFEWAANAGVKNIYNLLLVLSSHDKRYVPAPLLQKDALI